MSQSGVARNDGSQKVHFIRKRFQFGDSGLTAGVKIGRIPARAYISGVSWYKSTAFNSGTSDTVAIGSTAGGSDILTGTTVQSTGFVSHSSAAGLGLAVTTETDVFIKWTATGTAATAGDVTLVINFHPDNDL